MDSERKERIRYFGFAGFVGILLLLNLTGYFKTIFGLDTADHYSSGRLQDFLQLHLGTAGKGNLRRPGDLHRGDRGAFGGRIPGRGGGHVHRAGGRGPGILRRRPHRAAIHRFVEQLPRRARVLRNGEEKRWTPPRWCPATSILVRAGERIPADGVVERASPASMKAPSPASRCRATSNPATRSSPAR